MLKQLFKKTAILSITQVFSRLLSFVFSIIAARYLGGELFGKFTYIFTLILLLSFIVDFGLSSLIVREIAQDRTKTNDCLSNSLLIKLFLSVVVYCGLLVYAYTLSGIDIDKRNLLVILGLFLFIKSFFETSLCFFQAYEKQDIFGYLQLLNNVILCIVAVLIVYFRANIFLFGSAPVIAGIISSFVAVSLIFKSVPFKPIFNLTSLRSLLKRTVPFGLTIFITVAYARMGILMLSWFRSDIEVGQYGAAYKLIEGLLLIPMVISKIVYPLLSRISSEDKDFWLIAQKSIKFLVFIASLIVFLCIIFANRFIVFLYTSAYLDSVLVFQILVWTLIVSFPNYILGYSLFSLHKQKNALNVAIVTLFINISLNLILIPSFGIVGAAFTTIISVVVPFIGYLWYLRYNFDVIFILKIIGKALFISISLIVFGAFIKNFLPLPILIITLLILYALLSYLSGLLESEELLSIKTLLFRKLTRM